MQRPVSIDIAASKIAQQLPKGIFLCVGGDKPNVMTIGWGGLSFYWQRNVFVAPVRPSRHTYPLLMAEKTFTICVPKSGTFVEELRQAGTLSGRDVDKFEKLKFSMSPAGEIDCPIIDGCGLYLECRVLATNAFDKEGMEPSVVQMAYRDGDFHTLFYGEILACYEGEL